MKDNIKFQDPLSRFGTNPTEVKLMAKLNIEC